MSVTSYLRARGRDLVCVILSTATVGALSATAPAQENESPNLLQLQDNTQSPSDVLNLSDQTPPTPDSTAPGPIALEPVQDSITDTPRAPAQPQPVQPATPQQPFASPTAPNLNSISPQVSTLGDNAFSSLTRSSYYASPLALALGASSPSSAASSAYFNSAAHRSLLNTPEMFGDFRRPGSSVLFNPSDQVFSSETAHEGTERPTDFPTAASFSGLRVSENNVALPQDRVWFSYNHFHNGFAQPGGDLNLVRFTLGIEKTFFGGSSSIEVRLPIAGSIDPSGTFGGSTAYAGGSFGNLSVIAKRVLVATENRVVALGLAIETPTGSQSHALDLGSGAAAITIDPNAVYLTPYLGTLRKIDDIWFINSFLQVDVPTGGERLLASLNGGAQQEFFINRPTVLQADLGGGVWLVTPELNKIGLAVTSELHLATALNDADSFTVAPAGTLPNVLINQDDTIRTILNMTQGLHAQINRQWSVRGGISVPLLNERIFDTEVMVQVNRNY